MRKSTAEFIAALGAMIFMPSFLLFALLHSTHLQESVAGCTIGGIIFLIGVHHFKKAPNEDLA